MILSICVKSNESTATTLNLYRKLYGFMSVAGQILTSSFYVSANSEYTFKMNGGLIVLTTRTLQHGAGLINIPMYGNGASVLVQSSELYVVGNTTIANKIGVWKDGETGLVHIQNTWDTAFLLFMCKLCFN